MGLLERIYEVGDLLVPSGLFLLLVIYKIEQTAKFYGNRIPKLGLSVAIGVFIAGFAWLVWSGSEYPALAGALFIVGYGWFLNVLWERRSKRRAIELFIDHGH